MTTTPFAILRLFYGEDGMNRIAIIDDLAIKLGDGESIVFHKSPKVWRGAGKTGSILIFVDYMLPTMDGIAFITRLRAVAGRKEVPILMITANDDGDARYREARSVLPLFPACSLPE